MRSAVACLLLLFLVGSALGAQSTTFGVRVTITGPVQPLKQHPTWPGARVLHESQSRRYQAVEGDVVSARQWLLTRSAWSQAHWLHDDMTSQGWRGQGVLHDDQCLDVFARPVMGMPVVRVETSGCAPDHGKLK